MYKGYNLELDKTSDFVNKLYKYKKIGESICSEDKKTTVNNLENYLGLDGSLDYSKIFISHSHEDEDLAASLAGWLYDRFKLKSFIDSYVWGYCDDLLEQIDYQYSRSDSYPSLYSYGKVKYSTSHVHMMLSTALTQMINKTECIIFLNTDKSIIKTNDIMSTKTRSPWIYSEITTTKLIEKITPDRLKISINESTIIKKYANDTAQQELKPVYDADLKHLIKLSSKELISLDNPYNKSLYQKPTDVLDNLYKITHATNV